jgi:hypothetical protein
MVGFLSIAEKKEFSGLSGAAPRRKDAPARLVLHTTETKTLPEYSSPPHFTVAVGHPGSMPSLKDGAVKVWQHIALGKTAYALLHPKGTEETNHMGSHCVQIEIVTYVGDQPKVGIVGNRGHLSEPLMRAVAGLVAEVLDAVPDISLNAPAVDKWSAKGSFGPKAKQRFSVAEWRVFNGICGHEHVPDNAHWDPGELDIKGLIGLVTGDTSVHLLPDRPIGGGGDSSVSDSGWPKVLRVGDRNRKVVMVRGILQALGYGAVGDTDLFNQDVSSLVEKLQKDTDIKVDGKWGPVTHKAALGRLRTEMARADIRP